MDLKIIFDNYAVYLTIDKNISQIYFVEPTNQNWDRINRNYTIVNVSISDAHSNVTSFIDLDNSVVAWYRMDDINASRHPNDYLGLNNLTKFGHANISNNGKIGYIIR